MKDKILIITDSTEPNVPAVLEYLSKDEVFQLNIDSLPDLFLKSKVNDSEMNFTIGGEQNIVSNSSIKSIWYRRPPTGVSLATSELSGDNKKFAEKETQRFLAAIWHSFSEKNILWVNHPLKLKKVELNKLWQLKVAQSKGLTIPDTIVTNNEKEVRLFLEKHKGGVIMKTWSSIGITNSTGELMGIFTSPISESDLNHYGHELKYAPVIFQNYIPKKLELRITIVGNQVFTCAIHSQDSPLTKDDWRQYDFKRVKHETYQLPPTIEDNLLQCMKNWGLQFGAIDMILTPDNEYVFLEINPSGQWGWIEALTDLPITQGIAELLSRPEQYAL